MAQTFFVPPALADEDASAAETAAARALAVDGLKLAQNGECQEAVDKLERAEKLHHSTVVLARLGECYINLGKLVLGSESLRKVIREPLPADATPAMEQARNRAQQLVRDTKPKIAGLTITVNGPKDVVPTLTVDGDSVPATVLGVEFPVDPGDHVIEVSAPGYFKARSKATLAMGDKQTVSLELRRDPSSVAEKKTAEAGPVSAAATPPAQTVSAREPLAEPAMPPPAPSNDPKRTLAYVSYGVGVAGLGVGLIFGRAAMQDKDSLASDCPNKVCSPDDRDRLDSAKTKGTLSTISFAVGGAGLVLGTVFLLTSSSSSSSSTGAVAGKHVARTRPALRPHAAIGLGSVQVGADF